MKYKYLNIILFFFYFSMISTAQTSSQSDYMFLSEYGSERPAFTIYTNPGEDCSTMMNVSWATPPGKKCKIELTNEDKGSTFIYKYDESTSGWHLINDSIPNDKLYNFPLVYRCETFNDIPSKLRDNSSVKEMHVFDKHGFEFDDLEPDTEYSYRIVTLNEDTGQEEYSDVYRFCTAGAASWKAAVIGDFHHYSPLWQRLDAAMGMLEVIDDTCGGFDWVLSPGDVCAYGGSYNFWTELSEQFYYQNYMWATVQGNHDTMAADKRVSDDFFRDSHYFPYNGYEGQEGVSYWFRYGDVLFLMLNNEAMRVRGGLSPAIEWMERVVAENPAKYIVVVQHYEWIIGTDGRMSQLDRFYKTFDRLGVDLAISGNNHVYLRTPPLKEKETVEPEEGTFYVVTPSSDNSRGRDMKSRPNNSELIVKRWTEGTKTVGGMLMDVNPQRIEMTLFDRYGEMQDSFVVPAKR